jgi:hypothetical protein
MCPDAGKAFELILETYTQKQLIPVIKARLGHIIAVHAVTYKIDSI